MDAFLSIRLIPWGRGSLSGVSAPGKISQKHQEALKCLWYKLWLVGFWDVASLVLLDVNAQDLSERQNIQNYHLHVSVSEHLGTEKHYVNQVVLFEFDSYVSYVPPQKKIRQYFYQRK